MICTLIKRIVPSLKIWSKPLDNIDNSFESQWSINEYGNAINCNISSNIEDDVWENKFLFLLLKGHSFGFSERYIEGLEPNKEYYILVRLKRMLDRAVGYIEKDGSITIILDKTIVTMDYRENEVEQIIKIMTDAKGKLKIIVSSTNDELYIDVIKGSVAPIVIEPPVVIEPPISSSSSTSSTTTEDIPDLPDELYRELVIGEKYSIALTKNGNMWAWGDGSAFGDIKKNKDGDVSIFRSLPCKVLEPKKIDNYKESVIDGQYVIIRLDDGCLYEYGVAPTGEFSYVATRINNIDNFSIKSFHFNKGYGVAIKSDGTMFTFGKTIGNNTLVMSKSNIHKVIISDTLHVLALTSSGKVYSWGTNLYGELGNGQFNYNDNLQELSVSSISDIYVGDNVSYLLTSLGGVYSFGNNEYGQLGDGTYTVRNIPTIVETNNIKKISVGVDFVVGLKSNGKVFTWGKNNYGQIGSGDNVNTNSPYMVPSLDYISDITTGNDHVSVLRSDGSVYSWGRNTYGQIGDGSYSFSDSGNILNANITGITRQETTNIYDYYDTNNFELKDLFIDGTDVHRYSPYKVPIQDVNKIYSYGDCTVVIKYNTTAWVWGSNLYNQFSFYPKNYFKIQLISAKDINGNVIDIQGNYEKINSINASNYVINTPTDMGFTYINSIELGKQRVIFKSKSEVVVTGWGTPYKNRLTLNNINDIHYPSKTLYAKSKWMDNIKKVESARDYPYVLKSDGTVVYTSKTNIDYTVNDFNIRQYSSLNTIAMRSNDFIVMDIDNSDTGGHVIDIASSEDYFSIVKADGTIQVGSNRTVIDNIDIQDAIKVYGGQCDIDNKTVSFLTECKDGLLWEWSVDNYIIELPVKINNFNDIQKISYNGKELLALRSDGTAVIADKFDNEIKIILPLSNIKDISSIGYRYIDDLGNDQIYSTYYLLTSNGKVYSFGNNRVGTFGDQTAFNDDRYINELILAEISDINMLSKGGNGEHILVLKSGNTIWGWGRNEFYQLGNGYNLNRPSPIFVGGLPSLRLVNTGAVGGRHSFAIDNDGLLWGWGLNDKGQLGYRENTLQYNTPIDIGNFSDDLEFSDISSGFNHTLFLKSNGEIWASGRNNYGQLGLGTTQSDIPVAIRITTVSNIKSIKCGYYHSLILDSDGDVWVSGNNTFGQLGLGDRNSKWTFTKVNTISEVKTIDSGNHHSLALLSNGELWGWGDNFNGQLMGQASTEYLYPVQLNIANVRLFSGGEGHSVAIKNDGSIWTWGGNNYGELGTGNTISTNVPVPVLLFTPLDNIKKLSNGTNHNIALNFFGEIFTWGSNNNGQLFNKNVIDQVNPIYVDTNIVRDDINRVFRGDDRVYYITTQGDILGSGRNEYGQLGDETIGNKLNFRNIATVDTIKDIQTSFNFTTFLNENGEIFVSGLLKPSNDLENNEYINFPEKITTFLDWNSQNSFPLSSVSKIVGSYHNNAVITSNGGLFLGGDNTYNQKGGLSSSTDIRTLHRVPDVKDIFDSSRTVSSGTNFSIILKSDGDVYVMGINNFGQMGKGIDNDALFIDYPVKIEELSRVHSVGTTESGCIALTSNGQVWSWGRQSYGELGDGTVPDTQVVNGIRIINTEQWNPIPSNNVTSNDYSSVKTGLRHSMFIKSDGTVWGTGYNYYGQLGVGSILDSSVPVQVNITNIKDVSCGGEFTIFLKSDGTVWSVGKDNYLGKGGTLGRGSGIIENASLPIQVQSLSGIKYINSGLNSSVAIRSDGKVFTWGLNDSGQLGQGLDPLTVIGLGDNNEYFTTPTYVPTYGYNYNIFVGQVTKLYGNNSTFFIKTFSGEIYGWGLNSSYRLTQSGTNDYFLNEPTLSTLTDIEEIFVGPEWCFSKKLNGEIEAWGVNTYGQLGLSIIGGSYNSPQSVSITDVKDIYCYSNESLLLKNDGTVWACGRIGSNVGLSSNNTNIFTKVNNLSGITKIVRGDNRSVFLKNDGTVWVCGTNTNGVLGLSLENNIVSIPVVISNISNVIDIACYKNCTLFIKSDGTMLGIGKNSYIFNDNGFHILPTVIENVTDASIFANGNGFNTVLYRTTFNVVKGFGHTGNLILGQYEEDSISIPTTLTNVAFSSQNIFIISSDTLLFNFFGTVFAVGSNELGRLGRSLNIEDLEDSLYTEQIRSKTLLLDQAKEVSVAKDGMYCISSEGTVTFWGNKLDYNTLDETYVLSPEDQTNYKIKPVVSISTPKNDFQWSIVIVNEGSVYGKGYNNYGNLGNTLAGFYNTNNIFVSDYDKNLIKLITNFSTGIIDVKVGDGYYIFLTSSGDLYSIGRNNNYQLGVGDDFNLMSPNKIATSVRSLVGTKGYITETDELYKWGDNTYGQIGIGNTDTQLVPVNVLSSVSEAYSYDNYTYAFKYDGNIQVWGDNSKGQLGLGDFENRDIPTTLNVAVSGGFVDWEFDLNRVVAFNQEDMWAWGDNTYGQLGDGSNTNRNIPTFISTFIGREHIVLDNLTISMQISGGKVSSWGGNDYGQLTTNTMLSTNIPILLKDNEPVIDVSAGLDFTLIVKENGTVYGAGKNNKGQLGPSLDLNINFLELLPFTQAEKVYSGSSHSFVITSDGVVYGFGDNTYRQISATPSSKIATPEEITSLTDITLIKGGDGHTMAITTDGNLYGWGRNDLGQLGDNTIIGKSIPVLVLEDIKDISIGLHHNVALTTNGIVYTWGKNDKGQIGNGSIDNVSNPIAIASNVRIIDVGDEYTIIQKSDNTLWGWGLNNNYQMSNSIVTTNYSTPVQIFNTDYENIEYITSGESDVIYSVNGSLKIWGNGIADARPVDILLQALDGKDVQASGKQTGLLKNNGNLYMWGNNSSGQLGDGTIINRSAPKRVMEYVNELYMGPDHTMVLRNDRFLWAFGDNSYGQLGDGTYIGKVSPTFINPLQLIIPEFIGN